MVSIKSNANADRAADETNNAFISTHGIRWMQQVQDRTSWKHF